MTHRHVEQRALHIDPTAIAQLARECSIEMNVQDVRELEASRALLPAGKKIYVSHLPKQTWQQTIDACREVRAVGFDPVPHLPVRLLEDERTLDDFLANAVSSASIREVLLISGDYPQSNGPYAVVADVLRTGKLNAHGLRRVSLAGHPEGHPKVAIAEIRRAEIEKAQLARDAGLEATLLTQFFFEAQPFIEWTGGLRAAGVQARLVAGLAGPASIATLFRFAMRCGVGPSIRALGARPTSLVKLIGDHGPEPLLRDLATRRVAEPGLFDGVHLFCFGGFLRTVEWLHRVSQGQFRLDEQGGFKV
ncbi:MAG TPA: methylenetetrahydrofolate reductase [Steroidobacter sp.]|uniref:methylenetetrahydrofolate reductase n=1 Tax=Steroidobacter sp. TaxID=1978227 RepID=UPI002ED956AD